MHECYGAKPQIHLLFGTALRNDIWSEQISNRSALGFRAVFLSTVPASEGRLSHVIFFGSVGLGFFCLDVAVPRLHGATVSGPRSGPGDLHVLKPYML